MKKVIFIGLLILFLIPVPSLVAPDWTVTVVDENQQPVMGVLVREEYKNYSLETEGHEVDLRSDVRGRAFFPSKKLYKPLLNMLIGVACSARGGVHASFGPHDYVMAFGDGVEGQSEKNGYLEDWTGSPKKMESVIVLHATTMPK